MMGSRDAWIIGGLVAVWTLMVSTGYPTFADIAFLYCIILVALYLLIGRRHE